MQKDHKTLNKIFAAVAFLTAFVLYLLTLPPTTSFWDPAERIATAWGLQIPHPPGPPFYLLLGRLFSMFANPESVAYSINVMSALASSITVMLLYLIIVRLVREWKGHPDSLSTIDKIGLYGGGLVGALAFAVSDSHWFTSIEAETYALSLTFTALVVWLVLKWSENHDRPRNERWLLLIIYVFGLAFGVHLLSLLVIFFAGLIIYFKKYEFELKSFLIAGACSVAAFFTIYPITMIYLPSAAEAFEEFTGGLLGVTAFIVLLLGMLSYGIYYTHKKKMRLANIVLIGYVLILIGYSSFSLIYIRSQVDPAIDQNSPDTIENFISYLKREQYGQPPLFTGNSFDNEIGSISQEEKLLPRRHSSDPRHMQKYAEYDSDWHFFWSYQVGHMYTRYFNWNFIGRDSDIQDAPWTAGFSSSDNEDNPAHNNFFFLPFLLGLLGMLYHFQKDWKRAFSVLVLFIATGLAIVFYLNQTPFQPRERDYSYTGSFFAFSIWIGLGTTGLIELIKDYLKQNKFIAYAALAFCLAAGPLLIGSQTYDNNDRSLRYVASDYAYNLLNSTAPYSIIFTNGDNDTFPLWYLQEVEGVRTDVRVVNLSLLNTPWYIKQMKNKWNHNSPPVPISLTDDEVDSLEDKFDFQRPQDFHTPGDVVIPVDKELLRQKHEGGNTGTEASINNPEITISNEVEVSTTDMGFEIPVEELDDEVRWDFEGSFLGQDRQGNELYYTRIQDDIVLDILKTNQWVRPVYFAITVSQDSQLDLQNYFRLEGKAFRVVPQEHDGNYGTVDPEIHAERLNSFRFRETDNEDAYFDENIRRMLDNYRNIFNRQASAYADLNQPDSAAYWMRWGEDKIPFHVVEGNIGSMLNYAFKYSQLDETERALNLTELAYPKLTQSLTKNMERVDEIENQINSRQNELDERGRELSADRRRSMQNEMSRLADNRQDLIRDVSYDSSLLMVIQRIYFVSDMEEQAMDMVGQVESITGGRLPFPGSAEENENHIDRMGMGL
ncbi:MAG: DUF2723 domain-containing protein [Balneolales bacterium]